MKLKDILNDSSFNQRKILEKILVHFLDISREKIYSSPDIYINQNTYRKIRKAYHEAVEQNKPIEQIINFCEFFGYDFKVNQHTLIPRPETEFMVDVIREELSNITQPVIFFDIGTGSGVIGITCQKLLKMQRVYLSDINQKSLEVAKQNAGNLLGRDSGVFTVKSDLLDFFTKGKFRKEITDSMQNPEIKKVIAANLPYVPENDFPENTEKKVYEFESSDFLLGGEDGLKFYRRMLDQITSFKEEFDLRNIDIFMEMTGLQVQKIQEVYGNQFEFEDMGTFHFNIRVLKASLK